MHKPILTRTFAGHIAYVSDKPEDRGRARGHEDVSVSLFSDGTRTMRATCLIADPPHVVRDVVQSVDANMNATDCFVRVRTSDQFTGSAWFRWHDGMAESENVTAQNGRQSERMAYPTGPVVFCNHAITGDAWMTTGYPMNKGPGLATIENMFSASPHKQGATGPSLHKLLLGVMYVGPEQISVAAGTFATHHYCLATISSVDDLLPQNLDYDTWVLTDGSFIPALSMYRGLRRYELTRYAAD
ncbi:MAG: hypothetical protein JNM81_00195 [Rhodospirillaceae bacterium]|nr:hypothetical protein [Rhodospirillaceae bacterium]